MKSSVKIDWPTYVLHWLLVGSVGLSLVSGMRIAADGQDANLAAALSLFWLQGNVIQWHLISALGLVFVVFVYPLFLIKAKQTGRWRPGKRLASNNPTVTWRRIGVYLHWLAALILLVLLVSGLVLYVNPDLVSDQGVRWVHRLMAWCLPLYLVLHVAGHWLQGGIQQLLKMLWPRRAYGAALFAVVGAGIALIALTLGVDRTQYQTLQLISVPNAPVMDGNGNDEIWQQTPAVHIKTVRGANFPGGETQVQVKAVRVNDDSYWLFSWQDLTRSQKHLPLQKTEAGWKVLQTEFGRQDEDGFYEDKFALMLSHSAKLAGAGTAHLGPQPLDHKPGALGGRGLHYTKDGSIVDVWHWKSVRTGVLNQMDDNFFGPPKPAYESEVRYKAGYANDPKAGGGFRMNWTYYNDDLVQPKRLPRPEYAPRLGQVNLDHWVSDDGVWAMQWDHTRPWTPERDQFPVGTLIPSVLSAEGIQGDRGDITAIGRWADGRWTLEARRRLDTGSKYDVAIADGVYLWVAVFDHSQTRHSYHLRPVRLELIP